MLKSKELAREPSQFAGALAVAKADSALVMAAHRMHLLKELVEMAESDAELEALALELSDATKVFHGRAATSLEARKLFRDKMGVSS